MKDKKTKKELRAAYEARTVTGGVYIIRNTHSGQIFLEATAGGAQRVLEREIEGRILLLMQGM